MKNDIILYFDKPLESSQRDDSNGISQYKSESASAEIQTAFNGMNPAGLEYSLIEATLEAYHTKSLTPIIKEELKLKIQTARLAAGKEELPKPVFREPEKYELSPEEVEKKRQRREKNKIAAAKCRNKRKSETKEKESAQEELHRINKELKRKHEALSKEKETIISKLKMYDISIPLGISHSYDTSDMTYSEIKPETSQIAETQSNYCTDAPSSSGQFAYYADTFSNKATSSTSGYAYYEDTFSNDEKPSTSGFTYYEDTFSNDEKPSTSGFAYYKDTFSNDEKPSTSGFVCYKDTFSHGEDQRQSDFCETLSGNLAPAGTDFLAHDENCYKPNSCVVRIVVQGFLERCVQSKQY